MLKRAGILTDHPELFRRMNVHIAQCDSMIQDAYVFAVRKTGTAIFRIAKISGRGGTDFTPCLTWSITCWSREFRNLKGLLYFTDGDGIYPQGAAPYETTFYLCELPLPELQIPRLGLVTAFCLNLNEGELLQ